MAEDIEVPNLQSAQKDAWARIQKSKGDTNSEAYKTAMQDYKTSTSQIVTLYDTLVQDRENKGWDTYNNPLDDIKLKYALGIALTDEEVDIQKVQNTFLQANQMEGVKGEHFTEKAQTKAISKLDNNSLYQEYLVSSGDTENTQLLNYSGITHLTNQQAYGANAWNSVTDALQTTFEAYGFRRPGHKSTFDKVTHSIASAIHKVAPYLPLAVATMGVGMAAAGTTAAGTTAAGTTAAGTTASGLSAAEIAAATPGAWAGAGSALGPGAAGGIAGAGAALGPTISAAEGIAATESAIASGSMTGLYTGATTAEAIGATEAAIAGGAMTGLTEGAGAGLAGSALGPTTAAAANGALSGSLASGVTASSPLVDAATTLGKKAITSLGSSAISSVLGGDAPSISDNQPSGSGLSAGGSIGYLQEQMTNWEDTYGPTQDALSDYYEGLSPDSYAATNISNIHKYYQDAQTQTDKTLAQRGLSSSGLQAKTIADTNMAIASESSEARRLAPEQVAEQKQSFLNLGLGAQSSLQQTTASAYENATTNSINIDKYNTSLQQQQDTDNAALAGEIAKIGTTALKDVDLFSADTYKDFF